MSDQHSKAAQPLPAPTAPRPTHSAYHAHPLLNPAAGFTTWRGWPSACRRCATWCSAPCHTFEWRCSSSCRSSCKPARPCSLSKRGGGRLNTQTLYMNVKQKMLVERDLRAWEAEQAFCQVSRFKLQHRWAPGCPPVVVAAAASSRQQPRYSPPGRCPQTRAAMGSGGHMGCLAGVAAAPADPPHGLPGGVRGPSTCLCTNLC